MKKELIGKTAKVVDSPNKCCEGIEGKILDETKNTININKKILLKKNTTITINGKKIKLETKRPEERIKK